MTIYRQGEPVVTGYEDGAVVKISCSIIPGSNMSPVRRILRGYPRDLLFLAPDPEMYTMEYFMEGE